MGALSLSTEIQNSVSALQELLQNQPAECIVLVMHQVLTGWNSSENATDSLHPDEKTSIEGPWQQCGMKVAHSMLGICLQTQPNLSMMEFAWPGSSTEARRDNNTDEVKVQLGNGGGGGSSGGSSGVEGPQVARSKYLSAWKRSLAVRRNSIMRYPTGKQFQSTLSRTTTSSTAWMLESALERDLQTTQGNPRPSNLECGVALNPRESLVSHEEDTEEEEEEEHEEQEQEAVTVVEDSAASKEEEPGRQKAAADEGTHREGAFQDNGEHGHQPTPAQGRRTGSGKDGPVSLPTSSTGPVVGCGGNTNSHTAVRGIPPALSENSEEVSVDSVVADKIRGGREGRRDLEEKREEEAAGASKRSVREEQTDEHSAVSGVGQFKKEGSAPASVVVHTNDVDVDFWRHTSDVEPTTSLKDSAKILMPVQDARAGSVHKHAILSNTAFVNDFSQITESPTTSINHTIIAGDGGGGIRGSEQLSGDTASTAPQDSPSPWASPKSVWAATKTLMLKSSGRHIEVDQQGRGSNYMSDDEGGRTSQKKKNKKNKKNKRNKKSKKRSNEEEDDVSFSEGEDEVTGKKKRPRALGSISQTNSVVKDLLALNQMQGFQNHMLFQKPTSGQELVKSPVWYKFHPSSPGRIRWDLMMAVLLTYLFFMLPVRLAFNNQPKGKLAVALENLLIPLVFVADILLNFLTGVRLPPLKEECSALAKTIDRVSFKFKDMARVYLETWFFIDLISTLPFEVMLDTLMHHDSSQVLTVTPRMFKILRLVRLLKLARVLKIQKSIITTVEKVITRQVTELLCMAITVCVMAHLISCGWIFVALTTNEDGDRTWIETYFLRDAAYAISPDSQSSIYLLSMYWAFSTLASSSYGDIVATTSAEQIFAIVVMYIGVAVVAVTTSRLTSILAQFNARGYKIRNELERVEHYCKYRNLPPTLRRSVLQYFEVWATQKVVCDEEHVLQELSPALKAQVMCFIFREVVESVPFFKGCHDMFLSSVLCCMEPLLYAPADIIIQKGQHELAMYVLCNGQAGLLDNKGKVIKELSSGSHFGEIALFFGVRRTATICSITFCDLFKLMQDKFLEVLELYPDMKELIDNQAEDLFKVKMACYICDEVGHIAAQCTKQPPPLNA